MSCPRRVSDNDLRRPCLVTGRNFEGLDQLRVARSAVQRDNSMRSFAFRTADRATDVSTTGVSTYNAVSSLDRRHPGTGAIDTRLPWCRVGSAPCEGLQSDRSSSAHDRLATAHPERPDAEISLFDWYSALKMTSTDFHRRRGGDGARADYHRVR